MKLVHAILFFLALGQASGSAQSTATSSKPDPLVGKWRCSHDNLIVKIHADGTAEHTGNAKGTWKALPTQTVERKYQITWKDGAFVDAVSLDKSGRKYSAKNQTGFKYTAVRIEE